MEWYTTVIRFLLDTLIMTLKRTERSRLNSTRFDSITILRTTNHHTVSPDKHGNSPTDMECNCRRTGFEVIRMNHALYIMLRLLLADFIFSNFIQKYYSDPSLAFTICESIHIPFRLSMQQTVFPLCFIHQWEGN